MKYATKENAAPSISTIQSSASEQTNTIEDMKRTLADEYSLQVKTQNFHWNVEGPLFFSLHKLFEEQYNKIAEFVDESAELLRSLNSPAPGSFSDFKKLTSINECSETKISTSKMIDMLAADHTSLAQLYKARLEQAEAEEEISAVTLYEDLIKFHEKSAWMIRSHRSA
ncbi:MAG: Dps family protein [Bacillota bacterium]